MTKKKKFDVASPLGAIAYFLTLGGFWLLTFTPQTHAADKMVTPVAQTETVETGTRLSAPLNARPPADIDTDDLQPTLFAPVMKLLQSIQKSQKDAIERLDLLTATGAGTDRTDEVLAAVKSINERQVTIKGWEDNKRALEALTAIFDKFRERFESLATVDDVQEAVSMIEIPEPEPVEMPDLSPFAKEETVLALGDNLPTVANVREISANVASLTARLDEIAAQAQNVELQEEVVKLRRELQIVIIIAAVILLVIAVQCVIVLGRWIISLSKSAKAKAEAAQEEWFKKRMAAFQSQGNEQ